MRAAGHRRRRRRTKRVRTTTPDPTRCAAPGPGEAGLHRHRPEPAVGDRPDVRADVRRDRLRLLHRRRLQPHDRRAGGSRRTCAPRWCSTPSRWPAGRAAPSSRVCGVTPMPGRNSPAVRYGERLAEIGAVPVDRHRRRQLRQRARRDGQRLLQGRAHPRPGTTRPVDAPSTTSSSPPSAWVHWHNHQRLHGYLGDLPPAEFEGRFYATQQGDSALVEIKWPEPPSDPGRFNE